MPPLWARGVIILAVLASAVMGVKVYRLQVYREGYQARDLEAKTAEARISADALKKLNEATAAAKTREDALRSRLAASDAQRYEDNLQHEKTISDLLARARTGDVRLRVDVAAGSLPRCTPGAGTGFAAGPGAETRAVLMPSITERVLRLAADSARDVRDYNELVDRYNAVAATCNGEPLE